MPPSATVSSPPQISYELLVRAGPKEKFALWWMAISDDIELKFYNFIDATNKATAIICCVLAIRPFFSPSMSFFSTEQAQTVSGRCSSSNILVF